MYVEKREERREKRGKNRERIRGRPRGTRGSEGAGGRIARHPVAMGQRRPVIAGRAVIENRKHFVGLFADGLERDVGVRSVPLARSHRQIAQQVPGVEPRQRQAVTVTGQRCHFGTGERRFRRRRVHVMKEETHFRARDTAALIRYLDSDVLLAADDQDLNGRVMACCRSVMFHHGPHGILEQLEEDVVQMRRNVNDLDRRVRFLIVVLVDVEFGRGQVVLIAQIFGVLESVSYQRLDVAVGIDAADFAVVVGVAAEQQSVLVDEHADADTGHVEAIEEVVDAMFHCLVDLVRFPHLDDALGHGWNDVGVPVANLHQRFTEPFKFAFVDCFDVFEFEHLLKTANVPVLHGVDGRHPKEVLWKEVDLLHDVAQTDGNLLA